MGSTMADYTYAATNAAAASSILAQIISLKYQPQTAGTVRIIDNSPTPPAPTFTNLVPSTVVNGADQTPFALYGSGFIALGITNFRLFLGGNSYQPWASWNPDAGHEDVQIDIYTGMDFMLGLPGVYDFQYSTDGGANWTTTGLTLTVT